MIFGKKKQKTFDLFGFDKHILDQLNQKQIEADKGQPFIRLKVLQKVAERCSVVLESTDSFLVQALIKVDRKLLGLRAKYGFVKEALDVVGFEDVDEARRQRWNELLKNSPLPARGMEFTPQQRLKAEQHG